MTLASLNTADWQARASRIRYETRHFIDGKYVDSVKKGRFTVINPATGAALCEVSAGTKEDIDLAVAAGQEGVLRARLEPQGAARPHGGDECVRAAHRREYRALLAARHPVHGQADHRHGHHRRAGRGQEFHLFRRAHRQDRRTGHRHRAGCLPLHPARAARRRRQHRALELSPAHGGLESGARARRGKLGGAEARRAIAVVGTPDGANYSSRPEARRASSTW